MTTFVGFGFGAIQAGLFLYEAFQTGAFDRLVVAEVMPARVAALRAAGGFFRVNIAHDNGIETAQVGPVEIYDPAVPADRAALVEAVAVADEMATAIPSVRFYKSDGEGSLHRVLAAGIEEKVRRAGPQAVLYAAENHNHAAEILAEAVQGALSDACAAQAADYVAFLNTVIGKMSGVVPAQESGDAALAPLTPGASEAFLVEAFNRILVSEPRLVDLPDHPAYVRRLEVFAEKPELLPFEEAKLYGHNAMHAAGGYLAWTLGLETMDQLTEHPQLLAIVREAALDEAGLALCRRHAGVDPLFTPAGFADYVDDLLERMVNPYLRDAVTRVIRDPARKLGWRDRLVGALRVTLAEGGEPRRLAMAAAAAYAYWRTELDATAASQPVAETLRTLWQAESPPEAEAMAVIRRIEAGLDELAAWPP